ncbi:hypothetical protein VIGAN_10194100 [Vigna angularis var. angularis]|uniref:Uncharacterized protein n=1 Tax=Vigna angularis var. angularis TaxID=157739 RepID=A0A0S3T5Y1_PHAAN|nr:hypothetical protein VIGAN_10194100 [Vigna angularis var. angularis]
MNSLKHASLPSSSTSSITRSSFATVSTSKDANAAKGRASENSRLVIAILLSWGLRDFRSDSFVCSVVTLLFFHSSNAEESVLTLEREVFPCPTCSAAILNMLLAWLCLCFGPKKSRG